MNKYIYECPSCKAHLVPDHDNVGNVKCENCGVTYTVEEITLHINSNKQKYINNDKKIYNPDRYSDALTLKNIENMTDEALFEKMKVALYTEEYNVLEKYINEVKRRDPTNSIPYEYSLLMKYHIVRIDDLEFVEDVFYDSNDYRILYRIANQFLRRKLDDVVSKHKIRYKEVLIKRKKKEKIKKQQESISETKKRLILFVQILFGVAPLIIIITFGVCLFINNIHFRLLNNFVDMILLFIALLICSIVFASLYLVRVKNNETNNRSAKVFLILCIILSLGELSINLEVFSGIKQPINPLNNIHIKAMSISDSESYNSYDSTIYFVVTNNSQYNIREFGGQVKMYASGKSLGTWNVYFKGDFNAESTYDTTITFSKTQSDLYSATFSELTIKYRLSYLYVNNSYEQFLFDCDEVVMDKR